MLNNPQQIHLKLLQKKAIKKAADVTGDLIDNKIFDKDTKVTRMLPQNSSEIVTNETGNIQLDREIPK